MAHRRIYHHTYVKQRPERVLGYYWEARPTPHYVTVTICENDLNKWLTVQSKIHVNKDVKVGPHYSKEFSDQEIIKDLSGEICHRFGF